MDSDLSGGGLTIASGVSSRVAVLATLCRLVQMIDDPWPAPAPPVSLLPLHPDRHGGLDRRGQRHLGVRPQTF